MYHPKRNIRSHIIRSGCPLRTKIRCAITAKTKIMFAVSFGNVCLCLVLHLVIGKSLDLQYGYQEIEEPFPISQTNLEEEKILEFDRLSNDGIEEICKNFKVAIHIKEPESYINCPEHLFDRSRSLVKRNVDELEGSGDSDQTVTTVDDVTTDQAVQSNAEPKKVEDASEPNVQAPPEVEPKSEEPIPVSSEKPESTPIENLFEGGFDKILQSIPKGQNSTDDSKNSPATLKNSNPKEQSEGEDAKTGESKEKPSAASPNTMLLIVIGALGLVGALAFVVNFLRSRRENREIDEVVELEAEGKELKEMKPLMKSPLAQNGAKSLEYIDADPQIQVTTRVELDRES
ncbi:uncharacterized protein LOC123681742 [Harmonia axyridis]|uniref:uncharacterized protein LOC123681742 n=1 Tax=Harmonia axyridis TaxID=115357 RepID=UPI001E2778FD|nr:uncharacterized protein LOC123681742 [Harmonia axyridis]